jgi:hypothetical protein
LGEKVFFQPETSNVNASVSTFGQKPVTISVADFPPGIYFISITDEKNKIVTRKFVKM